MISSVASDVSLANLGVLVLKTSIRELEVVNVRRLKVRRVHLPWHHVLSQVLTAQRSVCCALPVSLRIILLENRILLTADLRSHLKSMLLPSFYLASLTEEDPDGRRLAVSVVLLVCG